MSNAIKKPKPRFDGSWLDGLSTRARSCLRHEFHSRAELEAEARDRPSNLLKVSNLGRRTFDEVIDWLGRDALQSVWDEQWAQIQAAEKLQHEQAIKQAITDAIVFLNANGYRVRKLAE